MQVAASALGRIMLAALFIVAGAMKVTGIPGVIGYIQSKGLPAPEILAYATIALEIGGGLLLIANRLVVPVALALAVFCVAGGVIFHNFWAVDAAEMQNQMNHFLKNIALAGAFVVIAVNGAAPRETA